MTSFSNFLFCQRRALNNEKDFPSLKKHALRQSKGGGQGRFWRRVI